MPTNEMEKQRVLSAQLSYFLLNRQVMITLNREQLSNCNLYLSCEDDFKPLREKKKVAQKILGCRSQMKKLTNKTRVWGERGKEENELLT